MEIYLIDTGLVWLWQVLLGSSLNMLYVFVQTDNSHLSSLILKKDAFAACSCGMPRHSAESSYLQWCALSWWCAQSRLWMLLTGWRVPPAFYFYSPTKCLAGHTGDEGNKGCWRGNHVSAKWEKRCTNRLDEAEAGTPRVDGRGGYTGQLKKHRRGVWNHTALLCDQRHTVTHLLASL